MRTSEQNEVLGQFLDMLGGPTGDGGAKRGAGLKPSWKVDQSHYDAAVRHFHRWINGEREDKDSGVHPLIHMAWRLLAIAWQEDEAAGKHPADPPHADIDDATAWVDDVPCRNIINGPCSDEHYDF